MNYNEQVNRYARGNRKLIKRPNETPGLEPMQKTNAFAQMPPGNYAQNTNYVENMAGNTFAPMNQTYAQPALEPQPYRADYSMRMPQPQLQPQSQYGSPFGGQGPLVDPLVANVAIQYGEALVGSGRQLVDKHVEKYVPISRLKYYFAVDTAYVYKKLAILFFPYFHADWTVKYDQNEPIQPRFDVNAPDLYIPTMAFLTYILVAGLTMGTKNKFSPEKLSLEASTALAWTVLEVLVQLITLYVSNISTNLRSLDLIAYSSYKYVGIIISLLVSLLFGHIGYIVCLVYLCASLAFFLIRTLKLQILADGGPMQPDVYGMPVPQHQVGLKRRRYFLLFVACTQPALMWLLTWRIESI